MFGLDSQLAQLSDGTTLAVVLAIAGLLGLRHASDPDHLAAVTTLVAGDDDGRASRAGRLGLTWGAGHATALLVLGTPIVLYGAYLPEAVQRGVDTVVGFVIVALAIALLVRWHRGALHGHPPRVRSGAQAYGVGLVHGTAGSAGVGVLLIAAIPNHLLAAAALAVFALGTAASMALLSTGVGLTLGAEIVGRSVARVVPVLGLGSLALGVWYTLGALAVAPYPL